MKPWLMRTVVFLARHAENVDASPDTKLSEPGRERAEDLARMLRDTDVTRVYSSELARDRDTAAPIAERFNLEVEPYARDDLPSLVEKLRERGGRSLVVGHGFSTPALVELLGGDPGTDLVGTPPAPDDVLREFLPAIPADEFDRLYIVTIIGDVVDTILLRYGAEH